MNLESTSLNSNNSSNPEVLTPNTLQSNTLQKESSTISNSASDNTQDQAFTLRESVEIAMKNYFSQLEEQQPVDLYNLVLAEVEAPLMESVMKFTRGNQTKASEVLGLNRGTLRKKLKAYGLN
ncbi:MAG: DNA-binding transcriptional regulator Fis [Gammaproteobacteria bacterium]|nr:MAG: DNA-binding transcriptional regulator Fis [Gammaproteobacteria bacterium]